MFFQCRFSRGYVFDGVCSTGVLFCGVLFLRGAEPHPVHHCQASSKCPCDDRLPNRVEEPLLDQVAEAQPKRSPAEVVPWLLSWPLEEQRPCHEEVLQAQPSVPQQVPEELAP